MYRLSLESQTDPVIRAWLAQESPGSSNPIVTIDFKVMDDSQYLRKSVP